MLARIIPLDWVAVFEAFEPGIGQALIVVTPANAPVLEKINDSGDILVDKNEAVTVQSECVAACRRNIVRLARGTNSIIVGEKDSLVDECLAVS